MFKRPSVRRATDLYINFDGASDNICYHVFYGLAWMLLCAHKAGWPLERIHVLRFQVCLCVSSSISCMHASTAFVPPTLCMTHCAGRTHAQSTRRELRHTVKAYLWTSVWRHHRQGLAIVHRFQKGTTTTYTHTLHTHSTHTTHTRTRTVHTHNTHTTHTCTCT